jgi:ribosome-binding factor A
MDELLAKARESDAAVAAAAAGASYAGDADPYRKPADDEDSEDTEVSGEPADDDA